MKRKHILVLNAGNPSRLPHLRKINSLRDQYNFTMILKKEDELVWQQYFVDRIVRYDEHDAQYLEKLVQDINFHQKPDAIITLSEFSVPLQSKLCELYRLRGPNSKAVSIGRNKFEMRKFAESIGIPVPKAVLISSKNILECKNLSYPVVAKPFIGAGSILVTRFDSFEELSTSFPRMQVMAESTYKMDSMYRDLGTEINDFPFVIEEIVGGNLTFETSFPYTVGEISVESIYHENKTHVLAIHDKPLPSNGPYFEKFILSTPTRIPIELISQAKTLVGKIHEALGSGAYVLHTEFRTLQTGLVLMEFGIRLGGGPIYSTLLHSTGNDFIEILIDLALNQQPKIEIGLACPTISHYLWAVASGQVKLFKGESKLIESPYYVEHQIYDDVGQLAKRAPLSSRAQGHVIYQSWDGFDSIEKDFQKVLGLFEIHVDGVEINESEAIVQSTNSKVSRELFNRI